MDTKTHTEPPELESYCGSWIIVSRATGKPVLETFKYDIAKAINQSAYEVLTAMQWLVRFNTQVKKDGQVNVLDKNSKARSSSNLNLDLIK